MREILFRGKGTGEDKDNWHFGNYLSWQDTTYCFKEDYDKHPENTKHYIVWDEMTDWCLPNKHFKADIDINTLGQYTGLTDKNGKKIFEGDILEFSEDYDDKFGYPATSYGKCIVIYDESLLAWRIRGLDYEGLDDLCEYADSEVIGNIHDNPELLKEAEQE